MALFSSGNKNETTTQTNEPWGPTQNYILGGLHDARSLYNRGIGFHQPGFRTYVGMSDPTKRGLNMTQRIAGSGDPMNEAAQRYNLATLNGQNDLSNQNYANLYGRAIDTANGADRISNQNYADLYGRTGDMLSDPRFRADTSRFDRLYDTSAKLLDNTGNSAFERVTNKQAGNLAADIANQFSMGGMYGTAGMTGAISNQVGDFRDRMASNNWFNNISAQRGIIGDMSGLAGNINAAKMQNADMRRGIMGDMRGIAGDMTNLAQQNLANQYGAQDRARGLAGDMTALGQQNIANRFGAIDRAPGIYDQQYAGAERMGQVGAAYDDLATRKLQSRLDKFYGNQQAPWDRLNAYGSYINGATNGYGDRQTTVIPPSNPWGGALGGAMAGYQIGGPWGAAIGGGLGYYANR